MDYNKSYKEQHTVVAHVHPRLKSLVIEEARQLDESRSFIIENAVKEYYDRRPQLVEQLRGSIGKHEY